MGHSPEFLASNAEFGHYLGEATFDASVRSLLRCAHDYNVK